MKENKIFRVVADLTFGIRDINKFTKPFNTLKEARMYFKAKELIEKNN